MLLENRSLINSGSKLNHYKYFIILYFVIAVVSAVLNYSNFLLVAKVFLNFSFINLILFVTILEMDLNEKNQKNIIKFIFALIFIQIPVSAGQYLFFHYPSADWNSGTISFVGKFDGTGIVAILMIFLLSFMISQILIQGFTVKRAFLVILTFIPTIAGGSKLGLILLPVIIVLNVFSHSIFYASFDLMRFIRISFVSGIIICVAILVIIFIVPQTRFGKEFLNLDSVSSPDKVVKYESSDPRFGRIAGYNELFNNIFKNNVTMFFGMGSDAIAESKFAGVSRPKLIFLSRLEDSIRLMGTIGLLGIIMVAVLILSGVPTLKKYIKLETSDFMIVVANSFIPSTIIFLGAVFYTSAWATQIGMSYWIILGILYQRYSVLSKGYDKLSGYYMSFMASS